MPQGTRQLETIAMRIVARLGQRTSISCKPFRRPFSTVDAFVNHRPHRLEDLNLGVDKVASGFLTDEPNDQLAQPPLERFGAPGLFFPHFLFHDFHPFGFFPTTGGA
jgi:hypothetical protein